MSMRIKGTIAVLLFAGGCVSNGEHERLMKEAKDACSAEMSKMQNAHQGELAQREDRIKKLETDLDKLGIDRKQSETALGAQLASTQAQLAELKRQQERAEKDAATLRSVAEKLKSMIDAGQLEVVMRKGRMTLKLPDEILFPSGSKKLKKEGIEALVSVIEVLKSVEDREFLIAGHTDNVPVKGGGFKSNWDLSTARAVEVVNLMIANGVAPERVAAAGYGEFDPVSENETPEGRQKNRRLEIILMPKLEDITS
jgi:chemotaxis protein MotB